MRKSVVRGRGRGRPAANDGGGVGGVVRGASASSDKSPIAPTAGRVEPVSWCSTSRPRSLAFLGVGKPLLKTEHQEKVLAFIAEAGSSSISSSSESARTKTTASSLEAPAVEQQRSSAPLPLGKVTAAAAHSSAYSMELFSHPMTGFSSLSQNSTVQSDSEMECTDAQPLLDLPSGTSSQSTTLSSQHTLPHSDPSHTLVALPTSQRSLHAESDDDMDEPPFIDDPVGDPDWHPLPEQLAAANRSEEEEEDAQPSPALQERVAAQRRDTTTNTLPKQLCLTGKSNEPPKSGSFSNTRTSSVWVYFRQHAHDPSKVICKKCGRVFSRGKNLKCLNTTCMHRHLKLVHFEAWQKSKTSLPPTAAAPYDVIEPCDVASPTVTPPLSSPPPSTDVPMPMPGPCSTGITRFLNRTTESRPLATPPPTPSPSPSPSPRLSQTPSSISSSVLMSPPVQLSLPESMSRSRKFSASHPRALALTACIAKLIALEMMPFRLVETPAFRELMANAVPRYIIPSRHFFARQAVPALHLHVKDRIIYALKQSVGGKVHLTTDAWTSRHGQGRYVSITAHWVNIVAAGDSGGGRVLASPRYRNNSSEDVLPSSSSSSSTFSSSISESSSTQHTRTCTPPEAGTVGHEVSLCSGATAKRQQAVLQMKCLGDKRHTADVLANYLQRQTEAWLGSLHLQAGKVVCDNGRNFVAAIGLANLRHVPCLAHTLNLVVQCFLNNYPDLPALIIKVRKLCAHIRRSPIDSARMTKIQQFLQLPKHRLIIDVATRWNSTLHMFQRLCEQRQAVNHLWQDMRAGSLKADMELSAVQWAHLKDLCKVLKCFEECTRLVSRDNAVISMSVPLMRLLIHSLTRMREQAVAPEEEQAEEEGSLEDILPSSGRVSFLAAVEEQEEDEEDESGGENEEEALQGAEHNVDVPNSGTGFVRDTMDYDLPETAPPSIGRSLTLTPGTLSHMCDYALRIIRRDPRIAKMMDDDDYWLASILDPRYKGKLQEIIPQNDMESIMANKQATLVNRLMEAFPAPNTSDRSPPRHCGQRGRGVAREQYRRDIVDDGYITNFWTRFEKSSNTSRHTACVESDRRQHFSAMVTNYMSAEIDVLPHRSFPFEYWACKLDTWPELAQYAMQELACPAASVLSERVFSAAGSILTAKRTRLATENVDVLTFIKMNQAWVSRNFVPPCPEENV